MKTILGFVLFAIALIAVATGGYAVLTTAITSVGYAGGGAIMLATPLLPIAERLTRPVL